MTRSRRGELEAEAERARAAPCGQAAAELERIAAELREQRPTTQDAEIVETGALMAADPMLDSRRCPRP